MRIERGWVIAAALAVSACGSGDSQGGGEFQAYEEAGAAMSAAVVAYGEDAAELPDAATCQRIHGAYDGTMAQLHERLRDGCGELDGRDGMGDRMGMHEQERVRDAGCVADAITAELGFHAGMACTAGDLAGDEAEAARHVRTMAVLMAHQRVRLQEAACTGETTGEDTFTCERAADGTFRFDGMPWAPGEVPPGGTPDPTAEWPHPCGDGVCDGSCPSP